MHPLAQGGIGQRSVMLQRIKNRKVIPVHACFAHHIAISCINHAQTCVTMPQIATFMREFPAMFGKTAPTGGNIVGTFSA